jgi:hypothetical protein
MRNHLRHWQAKVRTQAKEFFMSPRGRRVLMAGVVLLALGLVAGFVWLDARPTLRLVNATNHPVYVQVDGQGRLLEVPSTSTETADGGLTLRLSPGTHVLRVKPGSEGGPAPPDVVGAFSPYGNYLFAATTDEQCFFIQRTTYGVGKASGPPETALDPARRLWSLPPLIDAVFSPNPAPSPGDRWSTGGERIALRQRRCEVAP